MTLTSAQQPIGTRSPLSERPILLETRGLSVRYLTEQGEVPACESVNLTLRRGEILGIAGESACGKSTLLTALTRLQRTPAVTSGGRVLYHPRGHEAPVDLVQMSDRDLSPLRWADISIVMQSAMACLNPVTRLEKQFADVLRQKDTGMTAEQARSRAVELLELVGIAPDYVTAFPHQLSGGMRQRSLIALAMACDPELVVMDEPTTAVDVVMQRKILEQILALQRELGFAVVFVTHDLSLLLEISDRIAIMYGGRIVEVGTSEQLYRSPRHPYTQSLCNAFPPLSEPVRRMSGIPGAPPNLLALPTGCAFHPRCAKASATCLDVTPQLEPLGAGVVACHHPVDAVVPRSAVDVGTPVADRKGAEATQTAEAAEAATSFPAPPVLSANQVSMTFQGRARDGSKTTIRAVDRVSFDLQPGRIVALVGESGSGKTTLARLLGLLYRQTAGELLFRGTPLPTRHQDHADYYGEVQLIFQDPFASLNSLKPVRHILGRMLRLHGKAKGKAETNAKVAELLAKVNLSPPERFIDAYPTALSGGQRQRIAIARSLAAEPKVLLADEPTSMLDASIRLDILNLLRELRDSDNLAILYITHDIASARYLSDEVMVMYGGRLAEVGPTEEVIADPKHPYTQLLLRSAPDPAHYQGSGLPREVEIDEAEPVDVSKDDPGCRFAERCPHAMDSCRLQPVLATPTRSSPEPPGQMTSPGRKVACWLYGRAGDRGPA